MNPSLHARVDKRVCVGTTNCVEAAPEGYDNGGGGFPEPRVGASEAALRAGARACPVGAITLHDLVTGQLVTP